MFLQSAWHNDLLKRKTEGEFLEKYLIYNYERNKDESFVLNINAEWGFGKTYFLKNLDIDLKAKKHPVIYFDAWKNDFTNNPLLAFMSELNSSLEEYLSNARKAKGLLKDAFSTSKNILVPIIAKKMTGLAVDELSEFFIESEDDIFQDEEQDNEIVENISSVVSKLTEAALSEHNTVKSSIEIFKKQMKRLLNHIEKNMASKKLPMFILIDELDRCRPNYAIELLENIKHIFDIPGVVFIVATDSKQLAHSINAVYGNSFASERYLKRFFHQEYNLAEPKGYDYVSYLFDMYNFTNEQKLFSPLDSSLYNGKNISVELFANFAKFFNLSLRDQEQAVIMLNAIISTWSSQESIHLGYLLFLIMLKGKSDALFLELKQVEDKAKELRHILFDKKLGCDLTVSLKTMNRVSTGGYTDFNVKLEHFIENYLQILDLNYEQLIKRKHTIQVEQQVRNIVYKEVMGDRIYDDNTKIKTELHNYMDYVLRAGHFSAMN